VKLTVNFVLCKPCTGHHLFEQLYCHIDPSTCAEPTRRDDRRNVFLFYLHSVLNLNKRTIFALLPFFPTFSVGSKRRESLRPAFPISLHLVLSLNVGKVFTLPSLFPYIYC